jgi:guanylate kinase
MMDGTLFIVSAPSGAGKTSLVAALLAGDQRIKKSVSYTTRAARPGEENGRHYHFIDEDEFDRMRAQGDFLETALVHGNRYGTSRHNVDTQCAAGNDIVLEIDWQGAAEIRRLKPEAVSVFVLPPSIDTLGDRLRGRGQDGLDVIERRIEAARGEIAHVGEFDYVIINDDFHRAAQDLTSIVRAERLKRPRQLARHADLINRIK